MKNIFPFNRWNRPNDFAPYSTISICKYRQLVAIYHLLVRPWTDQTLIDHFNQTSIQQSFQLVRSALLDSCILMIYKLLTDGEDTNPSLRTMVRPFLHGNREKCSELLAGI